MAITREQVLHVAKLAHLDLTDEEVDRFREQLSAILDAVSKVSELDLADVPPTSHPLELVNVWRDEGFGDEPKRRIMLGAYALSAGYYEAYYGQAQRVRTLIIQEHQAALENFDLLVSPTSPTVAFPIGERAADPLAMYASDLLTIPSNLAGLPGLNVPCGLSEGLPVGLQLIGRQFGENTLFRAGHALEQQLAFDYVPERLRKEAQ